MLPVCFRDQPSSLHPRITQTAMDALSWDTRSISASDHPPRGPVDLPGARSPTSTRRMVTALRALDLEPGDKVALLSKNCA